MGRTGPSVGGSGGALGGLLRGGGVLGTVRRPRLAVPVELKDTQEDAKYEIVCLHYFCHVETKSWQRLLSLNPYAAGSTLANTK